MCAFVNPQFKLIKLQPAEISLNVFFFLIFEFGDIEMPWFTGDDLEIVLCVYSVTVKMNFDWFRSLGLDCRVCSLATERPVGFLSIPLGPPH
jgi:hypothetical protein